MDIDALFKTPSAKLPKLTAGANKRRMPDAPSPDMLKRMRMDPPAPTPAVPVQPASNKGKARAATVEDYNEDEEMASASDFAPGGDADYFAEEDEDGRFFGGGLTDEQKQILNIFDDAEGGEGAETENLEEMDITGIRRMLLTFDRAVKKNQDQRSKYPNDPTKFIDSEADLDAAIKSLLPLAQSPSLAYPELVKSGAVSQLVDLLSHENVDIVIDVVELVHELTDEDVGGEADDEDDEDEDEDDVVPARGKEASLKLLVDSILEHQIFELLVANLGRMNEKEESDRQGVYHTLGIFENTIGFNPTLATSVVSQTSVLKWLLERLEWKTHDDNRGYVSELIAILLQGSRENRIKLGEAGGVDVFLKVLSQYRKKDPADADEIEFMENVFDSLCSALDEPSNKTLFQQGEGVDLMVLMMKEKMLARSRSIKVLDHALSGPAGAPNCETFVEALGLKTLFSALMNKSIKTKNAKTPASEDTAHILGVLGSLFTNLESDSAPRLRVLSKFVEGEYEKVDRLLEIHENAAGRLKATDAEIANEKKEMSEEEVAEMADVWYLRRLDGGLFTLQSVDYILGWIFMEDDGIRTHAQFILDRKNKSIKDILNVLKDFFDNIGDAAADADAEASSGSQLQKAILSGLITFLEGVV